MFRRSLAIKEAAHGPDHPDTGNTLDNQAGVLKAKGELDEAEAMFRRALAIKEAAHGPDHPSTVNSRGNLGRVQMLGGDGRAVEGRSAVEEALRVLTSPPHSLPDGHPWVVKFSGFL
jgi:hypothetical protein